MTYKTITSATNPLIKSVVKLHHTRGRKAAKKCIIEGVRALSTVGEHLVLDLLFCTDTQFDYALTLANEDKIVVVPDTIMKKISTASTPSGLLGVFHIPPQPSDDLLAPGLVLAQISDPGNMGTLIRTAVACNLSSIVIVDGCDPWSPKVLQSSAGTSTHIQLFQWSWDKLISTKKDLLLYALVVKDGQPPHTIDAQKALLVVGNEAHGIPPEWLHQCDALVTLPMPGTAESLNAAVAGSITAYLTFIKNR